AGAVRYFTQDHLSAVPTSDGNFLEVQGSASAMASAFATQFELVHLGHRTVLVHPTPASLPAGIPWTGALGLSNTTPLRPLLTSAPLRLASAAGSSCGVNTPYTPCEVARAYNGSTLLSHGINGTGERIAVIDAYDSSEPEGQLRSDLAEFERLNGLPLENVSYVYPVPTDQNLNASSASGWGTEEALDLEWSRASAPGAAIDMVLAPNASVGLYYAVDWVVAHDAADIISLSWGEPDVGVYDAANAPCADQCNATTDGSYTLLHPVLEAAAAEGIGVVAATGDCGAAGGTSGDTTDFPSSDVYATAVGATVLADNNVTGAYQSEDGWSGNASGSVSPGCLNQGGSGGGFSPYPRPAWQSAPGFPANATGRGIPDVSLVGGPQEVEMVQYNQSFGVGGTSAATPMWAGIEAMADQDAARRLGNIDPSLYALARGGAASTYFHDVTTGNNGYPAGPGWDAVTGLGSPVESALVPALSAAPVSTDGLSVDLYAAPRLGPTPLATTFAIAPHGGTSGFPFVDVGFGDGNATLSANATGPVEHTYTHPGVYAATVTVVDSSGNSSTAPPVAIVVGGGHVLTVTLNVSSATPSLGAPVTLTAGASNGTGPYRYSYFFGDGTYALNSASASMSHAYGASEGVCAAVVVQDAAAPVDGGTSARIPLAIGGAPAPTCPSPSALTAHFSTAVASADLPGDLPFAVNASGGTQPVSVQYVSDDPYVRACDCGIFTQPGSHAVRAYVNDSLDEQVVAGLNVTLYPVLSGVASASPTEGSAPLPVAFHLTPAGGHFTGPPEVNWSFGDGATLAGSNTSPTHSYTAPGIYTATALLQDQGGGRASWAWVVDVTSGGTPSLTVTATIAPAEEMFAGV
ncbi:MAG TPA: PKD domain-containing protein, partial [Thermoplasmata archaeon]|nr:PKD domain-containing protein [Thermoplasmata archaeon]